MRFSVYIGTIEEGSTSFGLYVDKEGSDIVGIRAVRQDGRSGTFIRPKITSNGKLAADFPGVDPEAFAVDSENHIANG